MGRRTKFKGGDRNQEIRKKQKVATKIQLFPDSRAGDWPLAVKSEEDSRSCSALESMLCLLPDGK